MNSMRRIQRGICIVMAPLALAACEESGGGGPPTQEGELGNGTFTYDCHVESDAQCDDSSVVAPVDETLKSLPSVAVGATFQVNYSSKGSTPYTTSPVPEFIVEESEDPDGDGVSIGFYRAVRPGIGVLLGQSSAGPEDLVHVRLEEVADVVVTRIDAGGNFGFDGAGVIDVNVKLEETYFRAVPVTADKRLLSGGLPCMWTSSDAEVVAIDSEPTDNVVHVQMKKEGTATLRVDLGGISKEVTLTVGGGM